MNVYVLLEDLGNYDGGATILEIHSDKAKAEARREELSSDSSWVSMPEYRVEEYKVI